LREIIRNFQGRFKDSGTTLLANCASFLSCDRQRKANFMAKQTKITIETDSLLIFRGRNSSRAWCPRCKTEGETIALENLGVMSNLDRVALEKWLESGELHRWQTVEGSALICLNSLLARVQNGVQNNKDRLTVTGGPL
jgi:hypothetical protein